MLHTSTCERVGAGDEIQTRHNDRRLVSDSGRWVRNRQRWRVEHVAPDGSLTVSGRAGLVTLPADYAREHVQLAYFQTVHSSQGVTREQAGTLIDELAGWRSVYVGMTRGRAPILPTWSSTGPRTVPTGRLSARYDAIAPTSARWASNAASPTTHGS